MVKKLFFNYFYNFVIFINPQIKYKRQYYTYMATIQLQQPNTHDHWCKYALHTCVCMRVLKSLLFVAVVS